jgi:hypothetical protein
MGDIMKSPHGKESERIRHKRASLVKNKKASWFLPLRTLEETLKVAGL